MKLVPSLQSGLCRVLEGITLETMDSSFVDFVVDTKHKRFSFPPRTSYI